MGRENFFESAYSIQSAEETKAMYDRWAEVYDADLTAVEYQQPVRCAEALFKQLPNGNSKILDVGCGTGLSGLALKEAGFSNIDGCDLSEKMLEKAERLEIYNRLFACDLNIPPIDATDEEYDALTAVGVFSFGHVLAEAIDELLRVVKPGAPLVIGLNDHYYEEGALVAKLQSLDEANLIETISHEHGEHIPGNDLKGWVITFLKI